MFKTDGLESYIDKILDCIKIALQNYPNVWRKAKAKIVFKFHYFKETSYTIYFDFPKTIQARNEYSIY